MAIIRPFRGVRSAKEVVHKVASVPYDVVNREESEQLVVGNEINFLRVTRSEVELPEVKDVYSTVVYEKAKEIYNRLKVAAPMVQDDEPHFYVYKLKMGKTVQVGIAATFSSDDYNNNVILKHEKTRKAKEDDRTNHIITTQVQTGAVFLTYRGVDAVNEVVNQTMQNVPEYDFITADGVEHTVWVMPVEFNYVVVSEISKVNHLYIADGHHRAASAARSQAASIEKNPNHKGDEEYNYFLAVLFPGEQLKIMPYNRVVFTLNGNDEDSFFAKVKENFTVEETGVKSPAGKREFSMYINKRWYTLKPNSNVKEAEGFGDNLDVSILQNYLLTPVLGIQDPRTDNNIDFIGGIRGTGELEKLIDGGKAKVAFSLFPVTVNDLMNISDAGEIMPPKSTWFEPKLRDGIVVHEI